MNGVRLWKEVATVCFKTLSCKLHVDNGRKKEPLLKEPPSR